MKRHLIYYTVAALLLLLSGCRSSAPAYSYRELAQAGIRLGVDIELNDNHTLYLESARWIGVPYRHGGTSRRGTDCSALTRTLYQKAYRRDIPRSTAEQLERCSKVSRRNLREGDLVFFHGSRSKRRPTHVGIYLKEDKFIHASSSKGVIVSHLDEAYYRRHWLSGGRIRH